MSWTLGKTVKNTKQKIKHRAMIQFLPSAVYSLILPDTLIFFTVNFLNSNLSCCTKQYIRKYKWLPLLTIPVVASSTGTHIDIHYRYFRDKPEEYECTFYSACILKLFTHIDEEILKWSVWLSASNLNIQSYILIYKMEVILESWNWRSLCKAK